MRNIKQKENMEMQKKRNMSFSMNPISVIHFVHLYEEIPIACCHTNTSVCLYVCVHCDTLSERTLNALLYASSCGTK